MISEEAYRRACIENAEKMARASFQQGVVNSVAAATSSLATIAAIAAIVIGVAAMFR